MKKEEILKEIKKMWLEAKNEEMRNQAANAYDFIEKHMEEK